MGDLSFLNRNKSNQTQNGVFGLYNSTQKTKSAERAATKRSYTQPQKAQTASLPNFTASPLGAGSFFTASKPTEKKNKKLKLPVKTGGKVDPVYSSPVVPPKVSAFRGVPKTSQTKQAVATATRIEKPTSVSMNRIRSYDNSRLSKY